MVKDRSLFREQVSTALGAGIASPSRMLVELRAFALRTLRRREASLEEII